MSAEETPELAPEVAAEEATIPVDDAVQRDEIVDPEAREGAEKDLNEEVYVIYDGTTVVLSSEAVGRFYRDECPYADSCDVDTPCVNVVTVREYVSIHLLGLLDAATTTEVASNRFGHFEYRASDFGPDEEKLVGDLVSMMTIRAKNYRSTVCADPGESGNVVVERGGSVMGESDPVPAGRTIQVDGVEVPGTDGRYSDRYLELDDSQQHIYVWEKGEVVRDYEVSGFYDEYAVYGVFSIRNKSLNAWSPIAEKWMPFWMAFYYDPKQQAWFGIHELVYWTDENGEYQEESSESIGSKKSGGCVRLDRGQAEELYDWVQVGDPLLIHP